MENALFNCSKLFQILLFHSNCCLKTVWGINETLKKNLFKRKLENQLYLEVSADISCPVK